MNGRASQQLYTPSYRRRRVSTAFPKQHDPSQDEGCFVVSTPDISTSTADSVYSPYKESRWSRGDTPFLVQFLGSTYPLPVIAIF